jgi:hypothetical protein
LVIGAGAESQSPQTPGVGESPHEANEDIRSMPRHYSSRGDDQASLRETGLAFLGARALSSSRRPPHRRPLGAVDKAGSEPTSKTFCLVTEPQVWPTSKLSRASCFLRSEPLGSSQAKHQGIERETSPVLLVDEAALLRANQQTVGARLPVSLSRALDSTGYRQMSRLTVTPQAYPPSTSRCST